MYVSCRCGSMDALEWLASKGILPDNQTYTRKYSCLFADSYINYDIVDAKNTLVHAACMTRKVKVLNWLMTHGMPTEEIHRPSAKIIHA